MKADTALPNAAGSLRLPGIFTICALLLIALSQAVNAQSRVGINGGMEFGLAAGDGQYLDADFGFGATFDNGVDATNPWFTSHPTQAGACAAGSVGDCHPIESWGSGREGVPAHSGSNFIQLNSFVAGMAYQNVCFATNETINYAFAHRARVGTDQAFFRVKSQSNVLLQTLQSVSTTTAAWRVYFGPTTYTGPAGIQRLGFESGTTGSGNITIGNFLDSLSFGLNPLADLAGSTATTAAEGAPLGAAFIRLNGQASGPVTIALQRIAPSTGTAAAENDFTIAGSGGITVAHSAGSDIWLVTIPSGRFYDGGAIPGSGVNNPEDGISLSVTAAADFVLEGQEGFRLQILNAGASGSSLNWTSGDPVCANNRVALTNDFIIASPPEIRVAKISNGSIGTFTFALTNADTDLATAGTQTAISITPGIAGMQTFHDANSSVGGVQASTIITPGSPVTITETVPATWTLNAASCVDAASNPVPGTSLVNGVLSIPGAATVIGAMLTCTFTNTRHADLSVTKTNTPGAGPSDQANDFLTTGLPTTYSIVVSNAGPGSVTGAVVRDSPSAGLTCPSGNVVTCSPAAVCAGPQNVAGLTGPNGITLGTLAAGQAATLQFTCFVN